MTHERLAYVWRVVLTTHRSEPVGPVGQFLIVLVCLGIGGAIALVGVGYLQTYNQIRKREPVDIRQVNNTTDDVELTGTVQPHEETIDAPFTGTECVVVDWEAEAYLPSGDSSDWRTRNSGLDQQAFQLQDATGTVLVDPEGAGLERLSEETIEVGPDESPPPEISNYLESTEVIDRDESRKHRYVEKQLTPGDEVHVYGPVRQGGHSVDVPDGVDAVIGRDDPDSSFTVGEDGLAELIDQIKAESVHFVITAGDEQEAKQHLLKRGLSIAGFGLVFGLLPLVMVVAL
jgi:hypothetical protein